MKMQFASQALWLAAVACGAGVAGAAPVIDPSNDFLATYRGARAGDLDVLSSFVTYNTRNDTFFFSGTFAAPVGTTPSAFYVWGLDRGHGTERFNTGATPVGAGVLFDSVVIFRQNGTTTVNRFTDPATVLTGALSFAGDTVSGSIAGSLLPSTGFDKSSYTWNLWPRDALAAGNAQIADFAPDASNAAVGVVSEPHGYALVGLALGGMAWVSRRRVARSA